MTILDIGLLFWATL